MRATNRFMMKRFTVIDPFVFCESQGTLCVTSGLVENRCQLVSWIGSANSTSSMSWTEFLREWFETLASLDPRIDDVVCVRRVAAKQEPWLCTPYEEENIATTLERILRMLQQEARGRFYIIKYHAHENAQVANTLSMSGPCE